MRSLTFSSCKPLVEFREKPIMEYQIEAIAKVGCTEIALAVAYRPEEMHSKIANFESKVNFK